jgi:hypothetical protein
MRRFLSRAARRGRSSPTWRKGPRLLGAAVGALTLVLLTASPSAAAVAIHQSMTLTDTGFMPCGNGGSGEVVELTVDLHLLQTITTNGTHRSVQIHIDEHGTAIGQSTGAVYRISATGNLHQSLSDANSQEVITWIARERVDAPGPGNTYSASRVMHFTITPGGATTVTFEDVEGGC